MQIIHAPGKKKDIYRVFVLKLARGEKQ